MKKNILLIFTIVVSIFTFFKEDVYAETYQCTYLDNFFVINYDTAEGATFVGNDVIGGVNCGTEDSPCKKLLNVMETISFGKKLDLMEWNAFFKNGQFSCPTIFYSSLCYEEPNGTGSYYKTCEYEFAPYSNATGSLTSEPFYTLSPDGVEDNGKSDNIMGGIVDALVCTDKQKNDLINASEQEMIKFTSTLDQFTREINSSKNLTAQEYEELKIKYEKNIDALMNSSLTALTKYLKVCNYGDLYSSTVSQLLNQMKSKTNTFWDETFYNTVFSAMSYYANNGQDASAYSDVLTGVAQSRVNNILTLQKVTTDFEYIYNDFLGNYTDTSNFDCQGILTPELIDIMNKVLFYIKIAVPILLVIFGIIDFGKVIVSDDKNDMKKAGSKFLKRCIIGAIIFFVPTVIEFLINIFNMVSDQSITEIINCGLK